jgi:hypothetical protein
MKLSLFATILLLASTSILSAADTPAKAATAVVAAEPKAGTPERKAILDALRKPMDDAKAEFLKDDAKGKKEPVVFTIEWIRVAGDRAYVVAKFTPDFAEGVVSALLQNGKSGWKVNDMSFADDTTDYDDLAKQNKLPRSLFPKGAK